MNPLWLLVIIPGYIFTWGFAVPFLHRRPSHDQYKCAEGTKMPCEVKAAFWPLILPVLLMAGIASLGTHAESLLPSQRRQARDKAIVRDEKIVYGEILSH